MLFRLIALCFTTRLALGSRRRARAAGRHTPHQPFQGLLVSLH